MRIRLPFFRKKEKKEKTEEKPVYVFDDSLSANSLANRAYCHIEELSQIGPRKAGSVSSRMAANNIAAKLEEHSGDVSVMPLSIDSSSMLIWPKVVALLIPLSVVFLFVGLPYVALIPEIMAFVLIYLAGIEGKAVFSRFIKKSDGENVRARIEAETEEAKRVVITAHHDSAVLYRRKEHALDLYIPLLSISFIFVLTMFLLLHEGLSNNLLSLNLPSVFPLIFILISAVLSALSLRLFSLFSTDVSPGCGDNLSGVGVLISLAEYFSKRRLKRVSLDFISFDAEEFGCQGSQDYFSKNRYPEGTIVINIDGLYSADKLSILLSDGNGLVPLSENLALSLASMAKGMGYKMKSGRLSLFSGSTDARSAARCGLSATCITGMAPGDADYAHSTDDTVDKIGLDALEAVIALIIKYVESLDGKVSPTEESHESLLAGKKYRLSLY